MANLRESILIGTQSASKLHDELMINKTTHKEKSRIDVYEAAHDLDVPVMFRKLKGLLGAYLAEPTPGILITTERPMPIQRFTAAHELGHFWMNHDLTLDAEYNIGMELNRPIGNSDLEIQANSFAAAFLMPRWLLVKHLSKLDKAGLKLPMPLTVYQLALRIGCSYTATLSMLLNYKLISSKDSSNLFSQVLKDLKQSILRGTTLPDWKRDVWLLTEEDRDLIIEVSPNDFFMLKLTEASTAGYLLSTEDLQEHGFQIHWKQELQTQNENLIGGFTKIELILSTDFTGSHILEVPHMRPWESQALQSSLKAEVNVIENLPGLSARERGIHLTRMAA